MTPRQVFELWNELRRAAPEEDAGEAPKAAGKPEKFARIRYVDGKLVLEQRECPNPSPSPNSATPRP